MPDSVSSSTKILRRHIWPVITTYVGAMCQNNLVNRPELQQIWNNPDLRQKLTAMLQAWNSALKSTAAERLGDVACMLEKLLHQTTPFDVENAAPLAATQSPAETPSQAVDRLLDFPSRRLAVYGSLAPGKKNHHMMAGMEGTWRNAVLRGSLLDQGWGAGEGFPGFRWDGSETPVAAQVFASADLPRHWQRLDEFEGPEYQRILVPVEFLPQQAKTGLAGDPEMENGEMEVCNVYELA